MPSCQNCSETFTIRDEDRKFYEKIGVPEPTWCPKCRSIRRHGHINDLSFHTRTCDKCDKTFVSLFPQDSDYVVYCQSCWYSDERDDLASGREYDFDRGFFEQFDEFNHSAAQLGLIGQFNENCDYCESIANCKDCYLISECSNCEECMYSYWIQKSKDCLDCAYTSNCHRCYEVSDSEDCYGLQYATNCENCSDSAFLDNCIGCKNCLFSTNLRQKQYHIHNRPVSKEAFETAWNSYINVSYPERLSSWKTFEDWLSHQPRKHLQMKHTENCSGNYIHHAKNCHDVYHCYEAEDCAYGTHIWRGAKNCMDANSAGRDAAWVYESTNCGIGSHNVKFSRYCWGARDIEYCNQCPQGRDLFGCVSLKPNRQFCILNKQYSKEDYQELTKKIRERMLADGEYGEFCPLSIAMFGYNNSVSGWEDPLSKEEVLKKGWKWEDAESGVTSKGTLDSSELPTTQDADKSICDEILKCSDCEHNYKIIPQELAFYKMESLPIPHRCPQCRQRSRIVRRRPKDQYDRICDECGKEVVSMYEKEDVLCGECYQKVQ